MYCHPAYLTYIQGTSGEMLDWMEHRVKTRLSGEISITNRYADDTTFMEESEEN